MDCSNRYMWTEWYINLLKQSSYIKLNVHASRQGRRRSSRAEGLDVNVLTESWARQHSEGEGRTRQVIIQRSKLRGCCVTRFTTKPRWRNVTCILMRRCRLPLHSLRPVLLNANTHTQTPTHTHTHTHARTHTHTHQERKHTWNLSYTNLGCTTHFGRFPFWWNAETRRA